MINVVQVDVNSARLRVVENALKELSAIIGHMMQRASTGTLSQEIEDGAARAAEEYLHIGAAACHLLADVIEQLERGYDEERERS